MDREAAFTASVINQSLRLTSLVSSISLSPYSTRICCFTLICPSTSSLEKEDARGPGDVMCDDENAILRPWNESRICRSLPLGPIEA